VGSLKSPTHGLVPGCPAATFWMAMCTFPWIQGMRALASGPAVRGWVDDITAYVAGAEEAKALANEGARLALLYEQCGFEINRKKSGCAATSPATERDMIDGAAALGLQVQGALKDLGVVHGTTQRATVMARARWQDACTRLGRIGRMAIPSKLAGHFASVSAMGAGAYAVAGRMAPKDLLVGMRQWVRHACYRGSTAAQTELLLLVGDIPWRADPALQALCKPANFLAKVVGLGYHTRQEIEHTWQGQDQRVGPVSALKAALGQAGIVGSTQQWTSPWGGGTVLTQPMEVTEGERTRWLVQARCNFDLHQLTKRAPRFGNLEDLLDVPGTVQARKNLHLPTDRYGALKATQCGDVIVNAQAKHWNGGKTECACGAPVETKFHKFWECPRWFSVRSGLLGEWTAAKMKAWLPTCTLEHGLATWLPEVREWRKTLPRQQPPTRAMGKEVYTDGSALHPKDGQLRVAAWAAAWRDDNGQWQVIHGPCPGEHTAARAEIAALVAVCRVTTGKCMITSDCKSAVEGFRAIRRRGCLPQHLSVGPCSDLWMMLSAAMAAKPDIDIRWMPSHCTVAELCARGGTREDWEGNDQADRAAKEGVRPLAAPRALCQLRALQMDAEARIMRVLSEIQCRSLATRPRLKHASSAAKGRKRKAPALPSSLRQRAKLQRHEQDGEVVSIGNLADFANHKARESLPVRMAAALCVGASGEAPAGCHNLQATNGPFAEWGKWAKPRNGTVQLSMHCTKCHKTAHNSSRWMNLMRTRCGGDIIQWCKERHELELAEGGKWSCARCGLVVSSGGKAHAEHSNCPVWVANQAGNPRPDATLWFRRWVALAGLWHRAAYGANAPIDAQADTEGGGVLAAVPPQPQADSSIGSVAGGLPGFQHLRYAPHWCAQLGPLILCIKCGTSPPRKLLEERWKHAPCSGLVPVGALPRRVGAALGLGPSSFPGKSAAWVARWQEVVAHHQRVQAETNTPIGRGLGALARAL
jgi:ribonuclease HI